MLDQQKVCENVKVGVERLMAGQMSAAEFETFVAKSTQELDELIATKAKADERRRWEDLNWRTMY
jgi:hypothetical protein